MFTAVVPLVVDKKRCPRCKRLKVLRIRFSPRGNYVWCTWHNNLPGWCAWFEPYYTDEPLLGSSA